MAALFPRIYDVIDRNPNKHVTLRLSEHTRTEGSEQELWDSFVLKPLDPPGALSVLLVLKEPLYEIGSIALRKQLMTEHLLVLHERAEKELIGRRYPRKKIQDLLAGEISAEKPHYSALLEEVLCELYNVQKIQMNRRTKSISFFPPDLRLWTSGKSLLFSEEDNCWSFSPSNSFFFLQWLTQKEDDGWKVQWPTADGKFEDLKGLMVQMNLPMDTKLKKDEMAAIVGRAHAIQLLSQLHLQIQSC